jgi:hypothetical protein
VKCSATAFKLNKEKGVDLYVNKQDWVYYTNMSGEYHSTDNKIYLNYEQLPTDSLLDRALLADNKWLEIALRNKTQIYRDILDKHPDMALYVNAILHNIDIDKAIEAEDGSILAYEASMLDIKEHTLIMDLESFSRNHYSRWFNKNFILVDTHYLNTYLFNFYQQLLLKIVGLRVNRIGTFEVHDIHIYLKMLSTYDLGEAVSILSDDFKLWLYCNIDYIKEHQGTNDVLKFLIDAITEYTKVRVYAISLFQKDNPRLPHKLGEPNFDTKNIKMSRFIIKDNIISDPISINKVIHSQYRLTEDNSTNHNPNIYVHKMDGNIKHSLVETKSLKLEVEKHLDPLPVNIFKIVMDTMALDAGNDITRVRFYDRITSIEYDLTIKDTLAVMLWFMQQAMGINEPVRYYKANKLVEEVYTDKFLETEFEEYLLPYLISELPTGTLVKELSINKISYIETVYVLKSNLANLHFNTLIDKFVKMSYSEVNQYVGFDNLESYLDNRAITARLQGGHHIHEILGTITEAVSGIKINEYIELTQIMDSIAEVLDKLTSYSTHVINDGVPEDLKLRYNNISPMTGLIIGCVGDATLHCLEPNDGELFLLSDDMADETEVIYTYHAVYTSESTA